MAAIWMSVSLLYELMEIKESSAFFVIDGTMVDIANVNRARTQKIRRERG